MKFLKYILLCLLPILVTTSCKESTVDFLGDYATEEQRYPGTPQLVIVRSGYHRISLSVMMGVDPNIEKTVIYWNNRHDSLIVPIEEVESNPEMDFKMFTREIKNMTEGNYNFEIRSIDKFKNRSVPYYVYGKVYGDSFNRDLYNRIPNGFDAINREGDIYVLWKDSVVNSIGTEIRYTDRKNQVKTVKMMNKDNQVKVLNVNWSKPIEYRTMFIPDPFSLDTFYAEKEEMMVKDVKIEMNKGLFKSRPLATDGEIVNAYGNYLERLWDGRWSTNIDRPQIDGASGEVKPNAKGETYFTVDLGTVAYGLQRFRFNFFYKFEYWTPKRYELWGYPNDNPPADGSFTGWKLLGTIDATKDSRDERTRYGEGDNLYFDPQQTGPVRLIRVKCLENYFGSNTQICGSEITLWEYLDLK